MSKFLFLFLFVGGVVQAAIVNGTETTEYPSVVMVHTSRNGKCSATAVSDTTLITAGHCIGDGRIRYGKVWSDAAHFDSKLDIGVAVFTKGTFSSFSSILDRLPIAGEGITLVGYGETDFIRASGDAGKKRVGVNRLTGFADLGFIEGSLSVINHDPSQGTRLHFRSPIDIAGLLPGDQAMTGRGDSGGAIIIDQKLAGVVSFGGTRLWLSQSVELKNETDPDDTLIYEYDVSVTSPEAIDFLKTAREKVSAEVFGL